MRLLLAAGLALCVALPVNAEPLLGKVISVTPEHIVVLLEATDGEPERQLSVPVGEAGVHEAVQQGRWVRVWPGAADVERGGSEGARLAPLGFGRAGTDRTGVRSRLMRASGAGNRGGRRGR